MNPRFVMLMLVMLIVIAPLSVAQGVPLQEVNVQVYTKIDVHYTYINATYTLQFKGPSEPLKVTISLEGFSNLYTSICNGNVSRSWVVNVPSLDGLSTYNVTIRALWLMNSQEGKYVIDVPLNPSTSLRISDVIVSISIPPNIANLKIENLNYTLTNDLINLSLHSISPYDVKRLNAHLTFNYTAIPWLFEVKRLIRDVYLASKVVIDHVTLESFYFSPWTRQTTFNFNISSNMRILEVGDIAGPFRRTSSTPGFGQYRLIHLNDTTILQIHPRVSLTLGEHATIYIKYELNESSEVHLIPPYTPYADEVEVRLHMPEGSRIVDVSPEPYSIANSMILYKVVNASQLQNPQIKVEYAPPLIPSPLVAVMELLAAIAVIGVAVVILKRHVRIKIKPKAKIDAEIKKLQELFNGYMELARRIWRLHEDHIKGRIRNSTYRKRIRELKPSYLDYIKRALDVAKSLEKTPQISKLAQRIRVHLEKAARLEEDIAKIESLKRSRKLTKAEWPQKAEALKKEIEKLKDEVREINSKISRAIT
ncbi:MAG: hypothetical protein DRJ60_00530 [Thermoprotei archaeon]|nr:MAG: hypothetical protein DRJ60_00530 [Thermoprotei archaeon]